MRRELAFWLTLWGGWGVFLVTVVVLSAVGLSLLVAIGVGILATLGYVAWMRRSFFH